MPERIRGIIGLMPVAMTIMAVSLACNALRDIPPAAAATTAPTVTTAATNTQPAPINVPPQETTAAPTNAPDQPTATTSTSGQPTVTGTGPNLNIRAGPGTNYPAVGAMKAGESAAVVG